MIAQENSVMNEPAMLLALSALVKAKGRRFPNPNYRQSRTYSPQWKVKGGTYYYAIGGKVYVKGLGGGFWHFSPNGTLEVPK